MIFSNMVPLTEALTVDDIPYMLVYRKPVFLPRDEKKKLFNSCIIMNQPTFEASMDFMRHPRFLTRNVYSSYYIDWYYKEKYNNKKIVVNYKKDRKKLYDDVEKAHKVQTYLNPSMIKNRNLYFDVFKHNELYFNNLPRKRYQLRIEHYYEFLYTLVNNPSIASYTKKIMVFDVNAWENNKKNELDNPLMYLYLGLRKYPSLISKLPNIDMFFYTDSLILKINPSMFDEKTHRLLKIQLMKLSKTMNISDEAIDALEKKDDSSVPEEVSEVPVEQVDTDKPLDDATGDKDTVDDEIEKKINRLERKKTFQKVSDEIDEKVESLEGESDEIRPKLDESEELEGDGDPGEFNEDEIVLPDIEDVELKPTKTITQKSKKSIIRNEKLKEEQKTISVKGRTIEQYKEIKPEDCVLKETKVNNLTSTNPNLGKVKFNDFEKAYTEELMLKDTLDIITALNDKSIPMYVRDINIEDTSDPLNYKDTYTITLEDELRRRHTIKVDIPKFIDDRYIYVNGDKKIINKQLFPKPLIKIGKDTVQVCSNYNKITVERYGDKVSTKMTKLKKLLSSPIQGLSIREGDNSISNAKYKTTLEYDELSSTYNEIKYKDYVLQFNQKIIRENNPEVKLEDNDILIGFKGKTPLILDYKTGKINNMDLVDFIVTSFGLTTQYDEIKSTGKNFMFTRARIMNKNVPLILLLSYCEGISTVLKKAKINHYFSDKRVRISDNHGMIQFADGYLIYDKYPFENSILMNGLQSLPTKAIEYNEMDDKDVYMDIFESVYGSRILYNAFDSFYEFMIDPITLSLLQQYQLPEDFVSLLLEANRMLSDNTTTRPLDLNQYRVRSLEVVNAMLHRHIADAYGIYRATAGNKTPKKLSIPRDAIIKQLVTAQFVKPHSQINPIFELDESREISMKGLQGMNLSESYKTDKRAYDPTMLGIIGVSSSPDANVGIVRHMSLEPNIKDARGNIDLVYDDHSKIKDVNIGTPAEMATPMSTTNDYSFRTATSSKQTGHIIPIAKASPVLLSNGTEELFPQYLSSDFVIRAKDNGKVVEYDEKTGIMMLAYNDGTHQGIDLNVQMKKNASSGIFLTSKMVTSYKKGQSFKKNDIIAYNDKFFSEDMLHNPRFNLGSLQKVAIMGAYSTYEDAAFITRKLSEDMASEIVIRKRAIIGKNSNVGMIVSKGQEVVVGQSLIEYETSYDDKEFNKFLSSIGEELHEDIIALGKIPVKSKVTGTVVDIKIYSAVETDEMSTSLKNICTKYYKHIKDKEKFLSMYDDNETIVKAGILMTEATGKIKPDSKGKIQGIQLDDGIIIDFYIKYLDRMSSSDKLVYYSALKGTNCEVIPDGYEGYSTFRPEEEISSFIAPSGFLARKTPSIIIAATANKVLIELKRKLQDIFES